MATIDIEFGKKGKKGERSLYFTLISGKTKKRIPSGIHLTDDDLTPKGKFRSYNLERAVEKKRRELLDRLYEMQLSMLGEEIDADKLVQSLLAKPEDIDFFKFADEWRSRPANKHKKNYTAMLNTLERFVGARVLPMSKITFQFLTRLEISLQDKPRAQSLYIGEIRHIFREAMREYNNDYEQVIKADPFTRYKVPRQQMKKGVRSLTLEQLMKIYHWQGRAGSKAQMARDCFILSFALMGMNSADMFECRKPDDGCLKYKRAKTRTRRADEAYIEVRIHPCIEGLMKRYRDSARAFCFHRRYANREAFNQNINLGLKDVGKDVSIPNLTFYQARHTFATLSRNLMKFSKSDVDEALNHVGEMDIADVYIAKDFSIINENNFKLLEKVFGEQ